MPWAQLLRVRVTNAVDAVATNMARLPITATSRVGTTMIGR